MFIVELSYTGCGVLSVVIRRVSSGLLDSESVIIIRSYRLHDLTAGSLLLGPQCLLAFCECVCVCVSGVVRVVCGRAPRHLFFPASLFQLSDTSTSSSSSSVFSTLPLLPHYSSRVCVCLLRFVYAKFLTQDLVVPQLAQLYFSFLWRVSADDDQ